MHKHRYFIEGIKAGRYKESAWLISALTVAQLPYDDETADYKPFDLVLKRRDNSYLFFNPSTNELEALEGTAPMQPPLDYKETILIKPGDLVNIKEPTKTTPGNMVINIYLLIYPFGAKVSYLNGKLKPSAILGQIEGRIKPNPKNPNDRNDTDIYIDELLVFMDQASALEAFWGVCVPTGSAKSMTVDPMVIAERDRLLKEYADRLDDPVVITQIENQLTALDRRSFQGDVSEDFFIKDKSFDVVRKRSYVLGGLDAGLSDKPQFIKQPLKDGFNPELIPVSADATRAASFSRGALTAQGGELVNYLYRVFQNTKIVMDDCGTTQGLLYKVTEKNSKRLINRFHIGANKKPVLITAELAASLIGKSIVLRSPGYCLAPHANFCANCLDAFFAQAPHTLHTEASKPGSVIMTDRMKAMHGQASKVAYFDYLTQLT